MTPQFGTNGVPPLVRTWAPRGQTPILRAPLSHDQLSLIGAITEDGRVRAFRTSRDSETWINGGYFIFRPRIFEFMRPGEELVVEPFQRLIDAGELVAYRHRGFWASMDTLKDKQLLEDMLEKGKTPWLPWTKEQRLA